MKTIEERLDRHEDVAADEKAEKSDAMTRLRSDPAGIHPA